MAKKRRSLTLRIYMNNILVGLLKKQASGALQFTYEDSWIECVSSIPLSLSLPLARKTHSGDVVINYFDNLLPDNDGIRKAIAQRMSLKSQEVYDLLSAIGRDCVGAVQLVPIDEDFQPSQELQAAPVTEDQIASILVNLKNYPLGVKPGEDFRISIAGAQEKTAFLKKENQWHIPQAATPSSHIFKVQMGWLRESVDMTQSVENEWLCLQICKAFGLPTANAEIQDFNDVRVLVVERFDRQFDENGIVR